MNKLFNLPEIPREEQNMWMAATLGMGGLINDMYDLFLRFQPEQGSVAPECCNPEMPVKCTKIIELEGELFSRSTAECVEDDEECEQEPERPTIML